MNPISGYTLTGDLKVLATLGTAVIFGFLAGPPTGTFGLDLAKHFQKSLAVLVSNICTHFSDRPGAFNTDLTTVFDLLGKGVLGPQITAIPIAEVSEAHRRLETGETTG